LELAPQKPRTPHKQILSRNIGFIVLSLLRLRHPILQSQTPPLSTHKKNSRLLFFRSKTCPTKQSSNIFLTALQKTSLRL